MIGIPLMIVGCTKTTPAVEVAPDSQDLEMSFSALTKGNAVSNAMTRGFVTGSGDYMAFVDIADPSAVSPTDPPFRTIRLSAWNSTKEADYFIDKKFAKGTADEYWHANPKIYYPLGCYVDLLGYSAGDTIVAEWQTAHVVKLQVVNTQDDVLYSSAKTSSMEHNLNMTFHHSQAWIQFKLKANIADAVKVDSIYWENIYDRGELRLEFDAEHQAEPKADWNFFSQDLKNVGVDDPQRKLNDKLTTTDTELNMLLPEQPHTSFVILYTISGKQFAYRVKASSLSSTEWERSHKYTYTVNFEMTAITLAPKVNIKVDEHIDRMNSIDLIEGIFTVSDNGTATDKTDDKRVLFSKGNLQYRPSDSTWRFAENQYDFVGGDVSSGLPVTLGGFLPTTIHLGSVNNATNTPYQLVNIGGTPTPIPYGDDIRKTYDGWIDLFGFGTSGFVPSVPILPNRHYNPWETATADSTDYGPYPAITSETDWGRNIRVYEYITDRLSFRTLSVNEWTYLMGTERCINSAFHHSWMLGKIKYGTDIRETVEGMFLFPDDFVWKEHFGPMPTNFETASIDYGYLVDNTMNGCWDALNFAGVVFIPCAGLRIITRTLLGPMIAYAPGSIFSPGTPGLTHGLYLWTTTIGKCMVGGAIADMYPAFGCSVRLVTDWPHMAY